MGKHRLLLRRYAQLAGIGLVLMGTSGLLLNLPDSALGADSLRLLAGFTLIYAGLSRCQVRYCRAIVGGSGLVFLVMGMTGPAEALLDSAPIAIYEGTEQAFFWVVFGLIGLSVGAFAGEDESPSSTSERQSPR